jgi:hypothetical protein
MGFTKFFRQSIVVTSQWHARLIGIGLCIEAIFLGLAALHVWSAFQPPSLLVPPTTDNVTLTLNNLGTAFPFFLVLIAFVGLLVLLPGWIASSFLNERPNLVGSFVFGFTSLGGLVLLSQFLHIPSIWPSMLIHLGWQVGLWWVWSRQRVGDLTFPENWQCGVVMLSMLLLGLFALYLNPVLRLDTVDNWNAAWASIRLSNGIGTLEGLPRNDWNAWIAVIAWLAHLTGASPMYLYQWLGSVALVPLMVALAFGIMTYLTQNFALATTAAWLTMLAFITGAGAFIPGLTNTATILMQSEFSATDKWLAMVLVVPAALVMFSKVINQPGSWRKLGILLITFGAGTILHAEALTVMAWLTLIYLVTDLGFGNRAQWQHKMIVIVFCAALLFILIPLIFPRAYSLTASYRGTTRDAGLARGVYTTVVTDWFILNPALLLAPLLLGPSLMILLRGFPHSERVPASLQGLLYSWVWAIFLLFIPPFATLLDHFWFPTWLERFVWTLPFGVLAASSLVYIVGRWRRAFVGASIILTIILPPLSHLTLTDLDWRLREQPIVTQDVADLTKYLQSEGTHAGGILLSPMPGPQTMIASVLGPGEGLLATTYGTPTIQSLYSTPWWGTHVLKSYIANQVTWIVAERASSVTIQFGLQPDRYPLVYENPSYLLYRVASPLVTTPVDDLVDKLSTPDTIDASTLPGYLSDPYSQVIVGLAYQAIQQCDKATDVLQKAAAQVPFARQPYLQVLANCGQTDTLRQAASAWRDNPQLASTLLTTSVLGAIDTPTFETAFHNWQARQYTYLTEGVETRQVAQDIATRRGQPDLAIAALHRLPDILFTNQDRYDLAYWTALSGHPDPALFGQAGRPDLATLWQAFLSPKPADMRNKFQWVVDHADSATANLLLGQTCETLQDTACAEAAYQRALSYPNDPVSFYGAVRLIHLQDQQHKDTTQTRQIARTIAEGLSLSYSDNLGVPTLHSPEKGQPLQNVMVTAQWAAPFKEQNLENRTLNVTFTNSMPEGQSVYTFLKIGTADAVPLNVYVPGETSVTWPVKLTVPTLRTGVVAPLEGSFKVFMTQAGSTVIVADTPSWLPPKATFDPTAKPLVVFSPGLQLWNATALCTNHEQTQIVLTWLPTQPLNQRYTLYIHALDATGNLVSQIDVQPFNDAYPTEGWLSGYPFQMTEILPVHNASMTFGIGWYLSSDGSRLPLEGNTTANGNFVLPVTTCSD